MFALEDGAAAPHQGKRGLGIRGAAIFEMMHRHRRIVDHAVSGLDHPHAEIRFLVIGRRECVVEAAQPLDQKRVA